MTTTEAILEAAYQTREAWLELTIYVVFFAAILWHVDYSVKKAIKEDNEH